MSSGFAWCISEILKSKLDSSGNPRNNLWQAARDAFCDDSKIHRGGGFCLVAHVRSFQFSVNFLGSP